MVELGLVEQRYAAVVEVLNEGVSVTEAAARAGVTCQTVQRWLRRYAADGLVDRSSMPASCPHQMDPVVEARIVVLHERLAAATEIRRSPVVVGCTGAWKLAPASAAGCDRSGRRREQRHFDAQCRATEAPHHLVVALVEDLHEAVAAEAGIDVHVAVAGAVHAAVVGGEQQHAWTVSGGALAV